MFLSSFRVKGKRPRLTPLINIVLHAKNYYNPPAMPKETPKWLKPDGTDERLVNPLADLIQNFSHYENDNNLPHPKKAEYIESTYPEFVSALMPMAKESIGIWRRLISDLIEHRESPEELINRHEELRRLTLQCLECFVTEQFGSVESFIDWWYQENS